MPGSVEIAKTGQLRVQSGIIGNPEDFLVRKMNGGTRLVVGIVSIRNDGVDSVIATRQLKHHKDRGIFTGRVLAAGGSRHRVEGQESLLKKERDGVGESPSQDGGTKELPTRVERLFFWGFHDREGVRLMWHRYFLIQLIRGTAHHGLHKIEDGLIGKRGWMVGKEIQIGGVFLLGCLGVEDPEHEVIEQ